jgi:hypothetical protein
MAVKTFTSMVQFEQYIDKAIQNAIIAAARRISFELRKIVYEQYYGDPQFLPKFYRRTFSFLDSASYELIGKGLAEVGINTDEMHYFNGFDPDTVVENASHSWHGSEKFATSTADFWTVFEDWAEENALKILKEELVKQGLSISR